MSTPIVIPSIVKTVVVPLSREQAFDLFTTRISEWWPIEGHSVGGASSLGVVLDGSGAVETLADGRKSVWAEVVAWHPPAYLALRWHPGAEPGPEATDVSVTFDPVTEGTQVRLEHSGWERTGRPAREGYDDGWTIVVGRFQAAA